jgi:threonine/homoserine/homoserine lactone efflux protein
LILMPGPVVMLVIATSLKDGTKAGLQTVAGAGLGNGVLIVFAAFGITTIMGLLADLFYLVRYIGAAYLIWLGVREWRASYRPVDRAAAPSQPRGQGALIARAFLIGVTNPKAILFYIAFFPQFLDPSLPAGPQLAAMVAAFMMIALTLDSAFALLAGRVRRHLIDPVMASLRQRITGSLLIGTGALLAIARR